MSIEYSPLSPPVADIRAEVVAPAPIQGESRVRMIVAVGLLAFAAVWLVVRLLYPFDLMGEQSYGRLQNYLLRGLQREIGGSSLEMMLVYPLGLLAIFMLERWFPAVPSQKALNTGVVHDALWVMIKAAGRVIIVGGYGTLLYRLYENYLSFLTVHVAASLPMVARVAIGVVVSDMLQWSQHWLHHNVKWLWPFHAVHHSQRELNQFSIYRIHTMEYLVRRPVLVLPMLMLGLEEPQVTWWLLLTSWHVHLQHANVRSNFGPLRYLLVTPQSHRVHHSLRAEHINHNYGTILSVWDYLLGTQCRQYDVYPETGIDDATFPHESARSVAGMLISPLRQLLYPFRQLWKQARGRAGKSRGTETSTS